MFVIDKHTVHRLGRTTERLEPKFLDYSEATRFAQAMNLLEDNSRVYFTVRQE